MGKNEPATRDENNWVGRRSKGRQDERRRFAQERAEERANRTAEEQLEVLRKRGIDVDTNMGKECRKLRAEIKGG